METATTTTITRTTTSVPAVAPNNGSGGDAGVGSSAAGGNGSGSAGPAATPTAQVAQRNDETTRAIYNLKVIVFLVFLPFVLFAVFLKHLLDYLFALGLKEKDVSGKVALVSGVRVAGWHLYIIAAKLESLLQCVCVSGRNVTQFSFLFLSFPLTAFGCGPAARCCCLARLASILLLKQIFICRRFVYALFIYINTYVQIVYTVCAAGLARIAF